MRISEIIDGYKDIQHSVEASIFENNILSMNHAIQNIMSRYKSRYYSPSEALHNLEIMQEKILNIFQSKYFDYLLEIVPRHYKKLEKDWISIENKLEQYINQIKNDHLLREGNIFKNKRK
jgi:hypothetical protein